MTTEDEYLLLYDEFLLKHGGKLYLTSRLKSWTMPRGGDGDTPETYLSLWRNTNVRALAATMRDTAEKLLNGSSHS